MPLPHLCCRHHLPARNHDYGIAIGRRRFCKLSSAMLMVDRGSPGSDSSSSCGWLRFRLTDSLLERGHVERHEVLVSLWPDRVKVLQLADFVDRHPAVLQGGHVVGRPAGVVATQEARDTVLGKVPLVVLDQVAGDRRFPPLEMRQQAVLDELRALYLDVAVRRAVRLGSCAEERERSDIPQSR
jgi:hypothetical protein